ncbi:MAG: 2-hydroxy-3-oxopropionate reductase, partial [Alphaproteobacteria bacterium]|nr:2-hydroxy-3-oxopropionate reductase [Alphaproteobacteria bacterium]
MAGAALRVGFIGLGAMGLPMAQNLAKRLGVKVTIADVNAKALEGAAAWGGVVAPSPAAVAAASDVVFTMLPDDQIVRAVALGPKGVIEGARPGLIYVDVSTIGPWTMREVAAALGAKEVEAFGAAATLGVAAAREGRLGIFVDSFSPSFAKVEALIKGFAKTIMPTGVLASSKVVKLVNNLMVGMNVAITAEAIALAGKAGIPAATIVKLIRKGSGDSYALANHF